MIRSIVFSLSLLGIVLLGLRSTPSSAEGFPWQNPANRHDVNNDGSVTQADADAVVAEINLPTGARELPLPFTGNLYFDVDGDGWITASDSNQVNTILNAAATPTPSAPSLACSLMVDPQSNFLETYLQAGGASLPTYVSDTFRFSTDAAGNRVAPTTRDADRIPVLVFCKRATGTGVASPTNVDVTFTLNSSKIPGHCGSVTNNLCLEAYQYGASIAQWATAMVAGVVGVTDDYPATPSAILFLRNRSNSDVTLAAGDVKLDTVPATTSFSLGEVKVKALGNESCSVAVSGAEGAIYSMPCPGGTCDFSSMSTTNVANGQLQFDVIIQGARGQYSTPKMVTWSPGGGSGISNFPMNKWDNPPVSSVSQVTATVTTRDDKTLVCGIKINPQGTAKVASIRAFSDCEVFENLKRHYFQTMTNGVLAPRTTAYSTPLSYPNVTTTYGSVSPEIPFMGFMNAWAGANGKINIGVSGAVSKPADAVFHDPVVVVTPYDPKISEGNPFGEPILWGKLTSTGWRFVQLRETGRPLPAGFNEDSQVVVRVMAPHRIPVSTTVLTKPAQNNVFQGGSYVNIPAYTYRQYSGDLRKDDGSTAGVPQMWAFNPELGDAFIPFVNSSCIEMFRIAPPQVPGEPVGVAMKNTSLCINSRPWKYADVVSGRATFEVLAVTPSGPTDEFPTDLFRNSNEPGACNAMNPNVTSKCVVMDPGQLPPNTGGIGTEEQSFTDCEYTEWITATRSGTTYRNVPYTTTYPVPVKRFKPGCRVVEGSGCGANMSIRFSGYTQMMLASLGCFWRYQNDPAAPFNGRDLTDRAVSATLKEEGILPYSAAAGQGGAAPAAPASYDPTKLNPKLGYGCIPCRFEGIGTTSTTPLKDSTAPIPVDQDLCPPGTANCDPSTKGRPPIYKFQMSEAPTECIEDSGKGIQVGIRYFGSAACDGVNAPPGHFCTSSNVGATSCPASGTVTAVKNLGTNGATVNKTYDFGGSGNIAGSFQVPLCPGSKLPFDSVSASWSPLIVDVSGSGIGVSRTFGEAVLFDIKGTGKKTLIDWPTNNHNVAFLVRPNNGKVTSIKELFGDYKAENGFEALRPFDSNKDGKVDARDAGFTKLALWFDKNRDAVAQKSEIQPLKKHGVLAVYLTYKKPTQKGIEGKTLAGYYLSSKTKRFRVVEDQYFYEYWKGGKRIASLKPVSSKKIQ